MKPTDLGLPPKYTSWRENQLDAIMQTAGSTSKVVLTLCPTGFGKSNPQGTEIIMFSGEIKKVEDIKIGDLLMGPDSKPRKVLNTHKGFGSIYTINPVKGESWECNADHILSLKYTGLGGARYKASKGDLVNISIKEYLQKSNNFKHITKLWRAPCIEFEPQKVSFDPYVIGLYLADGSRHWSNALTCGYKKHEAVQYVEKTLGAKIKTKKSKNAWTITLPNFTPIRESLIQKDGQRIIPQEYLHNTSQIRLELLAGLLDGDGHLIKNTVFEIVCKDKTLRDGVLFLCRSLGLAAYSSECEKGIKSTGFKGLYHRIIISGDTDRIPTKISFKQASLRKQVKDHLVTGFKVEYNRKDYYYGIALDGDSLYLLKDFTVTHNSLAYMAASTLRGGRAMFLTMTKALQNQLLSDFELSTGLVEIKGANAYQCNMFPDFTCDKGPCIVGQFCPFRKDRTCNRLRALDTAKKARFVVSNYSFWLYHHAFSTETVGKFDTLVLDEAHDSPQAMANFLAIELNRSSAHLVPYLPSVPEKLTFRDWVSWTYTTAGQVEGEIKLAKMDGNVDKVAALKRLQNIFEVLVKIDDTWIIDVDPENINFAPKWVDPYTEEFLFLDVPKVILSSASVNSKTAELMGLNRSSCEYLEYPHSFPPESRMLTYIPTVKVRYAMTFEEKLQWIEKMDLIIDLRLDRKGIIHTISYGRAAEIFKLSRHKDIMVLHTSKDAGSTIRRFKTSSHPQVLLSPSVSTGWDFPGAECEYQVISKVPYPNISSNIMKARINEDNSYIQYLAKQNIVQMVGRGTRYLGDHCENFIVDDLFPDFMARYKKFCPDYFKEAICEKLFIPKPPPAMLKIRVKENPFDSAPIPGGSIRDAGGGVNFKKLWAKRKNKF